MYNVEHYIFSDKIILQNKLHLFQCNWNCTIQKIIVQKYTLYNIIQQFRKFHQVHNSPFIHQLLFKTKMT